MGDEIRAAALKVLSGIISSNSGPAAPCFDAEDYEVERNRGSWYAVDGAAIDSLRQALAATPPAERGEREPDYSLRHVMEAALGHLEYTRHSYEDGDYPDDGVLKADVSRVLRDLVPDWLLDAMHRSLTLDADARPGESEWGWDGVSWMHKCHPAQAGDSEMYAGSCLTCGEVGPPVSVLEGPTPTVPDKAAAEGDTAETIIRAMVTDDRAAHCCDDWRTHCPWCGLPQCYPDCVRERGRRYLAGVSPVREGATSE